eukprot:jgi/Ulvmu1/5682/UM024_0029.1
MNGLPRRGDLCTATEMHAGAIASHAALPPGAAHVTPRLPPAGRTLSMTGLVATVACIAAVALATLGAVMLRRRRHSKGVSAWVAPTFWTGKLSTQPASTMIQMSGGRHTASLHARSNHLTVTEELHLDASASAISSCTTNRTPSTWVTPSPGIRWVMNPRYEYALPTGLALGHFSTIASGGHDCSTTDGADLSSSMDRSPRETHAAASALHAVKSSPCKRLEAVIPTAEGLAAAVASAFAAGEMGSAADGKQMPGFTWTTVYTTYDTAVTNVMYEGSGYATADGTVDSDAGSVCSAVEAGSAVHAVPQKPVCPDSVRDRADACMHRLHRRGEAREAGGWDTEGCAAQHASAHMHAQSGSQAMHTPQAGMPAGSDSGSEAKSEDVSRV